MRTLWRRLRRQCRLLITLGVSGYAQLRRAQDNQLVPLTIGGRRIHVRKGTQDLNVALSCLTGEFDILRALKPEGYDGTIIDAGGYIGTSAIALSELFPKASVIVIEPSDSNLAVLTQNIRAYPNIRAVQGALVAKESGPIRLRNRGTGAWGFTIAETPRDNPNAEVIQDVPAVTLSSLGVVPRDIGILKLDIEGAERDLFLEDADTLAQIDNIYVELHDRIVAGCSDAFFEFSKGREVVQSDGEKYLSVRK